MSDQIDDGGPAFPWISTSVPGQPLNIRQQITSGGMSLRDYFAIHAPECSIEHIRMQQQFDRQRNPHNDSHKPKLREPLEIAAQARYEYADAMLKARKA